MPEAIFGNGWGNQGKSLGNGDVESGEGAGLELAQTLLDDGPAGLDGVEVRRVGRQVSKLGTGGFDQCSYPIDFVRGEIVHHYHLAGLQSRAEHVFEIGQEHIPIGRRLDRHHRLPSFEADGTQHGDGSPASIRCAFADSLAAARSAIESRHVRGHTAFIEKYEPFRIDAGGFRSPLFPPPGLFGTVLLTGVQTFF